MIDIKKSLEKVQEAFARGEVFPLFVGWANEDLTEGRGRQRQIVVSTSKATAVRLSAGRDVQGSDGQVREHVGFRVDGVAYGPVDLISPTVQDRNADFDEQQDREKQEAQAAALKRAKALGLSDEDIKVLGGEE